MSEQPPKNPENNTGNAPLDEREVIVPATEEEIEARANEAVFIDPEMADARVESLGDARDAVMAQFESQFQDTEKPEHTRGETSNIVLKDVVSQTETNSAVIAAEAYLREVQASKSSSEQLEAVQETKETEPGPGIIARVHDRVEHARAIVDNAEQKITSTLGRVENILRRVEGYLDEFEDKNSVQAKMLGIDDKVEKIHFLVSKTANIIGETHSAISDGARALDTPLRMLETLTDRSGEDTETQNVAMESARELRELKNVSPTSLGHEDLGGIDGNIRDLQDVRLSREGKLELVRGTLRMIRAYNEARGDAERPDSPKKSQLQHVAKGLELYLSVRH